MIAHSNAVVYPDFQGMVKINTHKRDFIDCFSSVHMNIYSTCEKRIFWKNQLGFNCIQSKLKPAFVSGQHFNYNEEWVYVDITMCLGPHSYTNVEELLEELKLWYPNYNKSRIAELVYTNDDTPGVYNVHRQLNQYSYSVIFAIPADVIEQNGGTVFLSHVGILIGFEEYANKARHPLSARTFKDVVTHDMHVRHCGDGQLKILAVDNSGSDHVYWYNTGFTFNNNNFTFPIRTIKDPTKKSGFYVTVLDGRAEYQTIHIDLGEGEKKLGLYLSRKQAEVFGSAQERHKIEMQDRENINNKLKLDLTERKIKMDEIQLKMRDKEMEVQKLKVQLEELEAKHARERFELEREFKLKEDAMRIEELRLKQEELNSKEKVHKKKVVGDVLKSIVDIVKGVLGIAPFVVLFITGVSKFLKSRKT